jgi:hypothetical protein
MCLSLPMATLLTVQTTQRTSQLLVGLILDLLVVAIIGEGQEGDREIRASHTQEQVAILH